MLVVHAGWVPTAEGEASELFLWGEGDDEAAWRPRLGGGPPLHPFGASPAALRDALAELGLEGSLAPTTAIVLLPSGAAETARTDAVAVGARPRPAGAET